MVDVKTSDIQVYARELMQDDPRQENGTQHREQDNAGRTGREFPRLFFFHLPVEDWSH
jgi:hypothetical protein